MPAFSLARIAFALALGVLGLGLSIGAAGAADVKLPAHAPAIYTVDVSPTVITSYAHVSALVHTSGDIQVVAVSVGHLKPAHLERTSPGTFAGTFAMPWLPFFLHRTYVVTFTGYDLRGHSASSQVTIEVR